nr:T9SS type A sorting domain-containing protein [Bacteroidota bacterium]
MVNIKASSQIKNVKVLDHIGRLVYERTATSNMLKINTEHLESGLYHFRIQTSTGIMVESVIIE